MAKRKRSKSPTKSSTKSTTKSINAKSSTPTSNTSVSKATRLLMSDSNSGTKFVTIINKSGYRTYPEDHPELSRTVHETHAKSSSTSGVHEYFRYARANWKSFISDNILDEFLQLCDRTRRDWK